MIVRLPILASVVAAKALLLADLISVSFAELLTMGGRHPSLKFSVIVMSTHQMDQLLLRLPASQMM